MQPSPTAQLPATSMLAFRAVPEPAEPDAIDEARRTSFDRKAKLYDAVRPSYPAALVDDVIARCSPRRMLEIGAGTGKATVGWPAHAASSWRSSRGPTSPRCCGATSPGSRM
jgi:hypothetical protein